MNVIVSNVNKQIIEELEFDTIKVMNGEFSVEELIQTFSNFFFNKMILDVTSIKDYSNLKNIQKLSMNLDMDKVILVLNNAPEFDSQAFLSKIISMGIYNFTKTQDGIKYLYEHPNSYKDVAHIQQFDTVINQTTETIIEKNQAIIGFKDVTENAGATTLIYMLKKVLVDHYNVGTIELNKKDFMYFNDKDMISVKSTELGPLLLKYKDKDVILIDLNGNIDDNLKNSCNEIFYLVEPSTIKLNKLLFLHKDIFTKLVNENIVLNKSLLDKKSIKKFEYETSAKVFYSIPPLNDKEDNSDVLLPFLEKIGLVKKQITVKKENNRKNLFSFFKSN